MATRVRINPLVLFVVGSIGTRKSGLISGLVETKPAVIFSNNYPGPVAASVNCGEEINIQGGKPPGPIVFTPSTSIERNEAVVDFVTARVRNCVAVLDDIRDWSQSNTRIKAGLAVLFGRCRKNNVDIVVSMHGFEQIPGDTMSYKPAFLIKETGAPPPDWLIKKMRKPDEFIKVVNEVNKRAEKDPFACSFYEPY